MADEKISRFHTLGGERVEDDVRVWRDRPVIEGDNHLMIFERQHLLVIQAADPIKFGWADSENAARAERVRIVRARLRCASEPTGEPKQNTNQATH